MGWIKSHINIEKNSKKKCNKQILKLLFYIYMAGNNKIPHPPWRMPIIFFLIFKTKLYKKLIYQI